MDYNYRDLYHLIEVQKKIHDHNRPVKHECRDESDRYDKGPHGKRVANKTEFCIAAGREDSSYQGGVYGSSENVVAAHHEHDEQIVFGRFRKVCKMQDNGSGGGA